MNHHTSVSEFPQPSAGNSSQPLQTPATSSYISLQSLSETRNGSYSIIASKRKNTQMSPLRSTTPVKPLGPMPTTSSNAQKHSYPRIDSQITLNSLTLTSPQNIPQFSEDKFAKKTNPYLSKSAVRGSSKAYSPRHSVSDSSPLGTSQSFIKKSNDGSIYMKIDISRTPTKVKSAKKHVNNNNHVHILGSKLEDLIQKLQKHKDGLINYLNPQTERMDGQKGGPIIGKGESGIFFSGNIGEDLQDIFLKTFHNCENDWKIFAEEMKRAGFSQKNLLLASENQQKSDQSLDSALKLNSEEKETCESDLKHFADEMRKFKEDVNNEKSKIMNVITQQAKEKDRAEENIDNFLIKLMKFRDRLNTKLNNISASMSINNGHGMEESELESLLNDNRVLLGEKLSVKLSERSQSRNRDFIPSKKIDLEQLEQTITTKPTKETLKADICKKNEESSKAGKEEPRATIFNTEQICEENGGKALKKELEFVKKELKKAREENVKMEKTLEALQAERTDIKEQLQQAKEVFKKENNTFRHAVGETTPITKRKQASKGASSYRKTIDATDSSKKTNVMGYFSTKNDEPKKLSKEFSREQLTSTLNRLSGECQTTRGENENRSDAPKSPTSARGNLQSLLEKLNLLTDEYEVYRGQKEQSLRDIQEVKGKEYGKLVNILKERESSIQNLKEENDKLRSEAGKMAKQLGLYCWSPREMLSIQKHLNKKADNASSHKTLTEGSLNYSINLSEKTRNEIEGKRKGKDGEVLGKKKLTQRKEDKEKREDEVAEIKRENAWHASTTKENLGIKKGLIEKIAMMGKEGAARGDLNKEHRKFREKAESFIKG